MNKSIEKIIAKSYEIYENDDNVLDLDIKFVNGNLKQGFYKGTYNTAWVYGRDCGSFDVFYEGNSVPICIRLNYSRGTESDDFTVINDSFLKLKEFLISKKFPVQLYIFINKQESCFGFAMVQVK